MPNLALVTGASAGIGRALAQYHASKGGDVILVARRQDVLDSFADDLRREHDIDVQVIALDLGAQNGARDLAERVRDRDIDILINNAGFGGRGHHVDRPLDDELGMIDLNVGALVTLCHEIGGAMAKRGTGRILNVGSTAGFMPGPEQAVYFGTKAFVNSFSQALDHELRTRGVTSTVLVPGYVDTDFAERSDLTGTKLVSGDSRTADQVAKIGYDAMLAGKLVAFDRASMSLLVGWVFPFLPRRLGLKMISDMQKKG